MTTEQQTPILTLTLNPALDMATTVPEMVPDRKLRCAAPLLDPGGGGLNVSRAVTVLGGESLALVALGGLTGDRLAGLIRAESVPFLALMGPGETRQSLTVTEEKSGRQYRFMLPGPVWSEADQGRVFLLLRASARVGAYGVISGSQPPGVPGDFLAQLARSMAGLQVLLDTSGAALKQAVAHPIPGLFVLRMDDLEAEELAGHALTTRVQSADFAASLVARGVAQKVILARGADGSVLAEAGQRLFVKAAPVKVVSKVGAGDSFVAGFVLALARGGTSAQAMAYGAAAASAAVMTDATQLCRLADVERILPDCWVEAI
ncbi:MAG: 6-phosphofructokinase [Rhodobacteraceae bacterium]|uniref:1-phosphofructokinase family hexose kinase n=1 Tax=Cypionkella sp. TaxID=2811411 RepID=UPI001328BA74|nr:1-phosphofructokinase family hexose kinase [Cypionkella sp.]KAF0174412.1 MAG: 6-phosphofructokinase [Paracoccaceae bacterium]MDO8326541.1 1-phosphofructokinase family hexose kinase [Cypionkella sp.]